MGGSKINRKRRRVASLPVHLWTTWKSRCPTSSSVVWFLLLAVCWLLALLAAVSSSSNQGVFDFDLLPACSLIRAGFLICLV